MTVFLDNVGVEATLEVVASELISSTDIDESEIVDNVDDCEAADKVSDFETTLTVEVTLDVTSAELLEVLLV